MDWDYKRELENVVMQEIAERQKDVDSMYRIIHKYIAISSIKCGLRDIPAFNQYNITIQFATRYDFKLNPYFKLNLQPMDNWNVTEKDIAKDTEVILSNIEDFLKKFLTIFREN